MLTTLWRTILPILFSLGLAQQAHADTLPDLTSLSKEMAQRLQAALVDSQSMDLVLLPGSAKISHADHRLLSERFAALGVLKQEEAQQVLTRYRELQGKTIPFRVDPLEVSNTAGPHSICVIKLDVESSHTVDSMLSFLNMDREALQQAGVDPATLSVKRMFRHIAYHELWHCLDTTQIAALEDFAMQLDTMDMGKDGAEILHAMLINYAEIGADLFAAMIDMKDFCNLHCTDLLIAVREANLKQRQDIEHYTAPGLRLLKLTPADFFKSASMPQIVQQVLTLRKRALDPIQFIEQYRSLPESPPLTHSH